MSAKRAREDCKFNIEDELYSLILKLEKENKLYYDFDKILKDFKKSLEDNCEGMMNCCVACGEDIGRTNPRQLCGKTYCINDGYDSFS